VEERVFDGQSFSLRGCVEFLIGGNQHRAETGVKPLRAMFSRQDCRIGYGRLTQGKGKGPLWLLPACGATIPTSS
jgi:hypothetical protein